ncbi:uncharacterized protein LOC125254630 isoform X3 [Megalobrama amblycephala]|uniref:uncharacterized protein LOC125246570 isoform X4 n=1 Tax=Megalobrama amblycephala TaxID=75352 RepID=UPI0020145D8C|nr:uncharacterized protein LOC125246570 isoform X4 [Megalobrama amblycephala]XP_048025282.1 uncharacterized protein LOC125254630 isoform X3 [Megalobrama amblycephala]
MITGDFFLIPHSSEQLPREVMLFVRAVWNENGKEMEGTIPDAWVNVAEKTLRWPKTRAKYCFENHVAPKDDWDMFPLLKVKFTAESLHECEEYDQTSHAEQCEDEDEEVIVRKRMKKTKTFEDYVEGSDLSEATAEGEDKEERKGDASPEIPVFPTPPIKMSKNGSPRSVGQEKSTIRTPKSVDRNRSSSGTPKSVDRNRSSSGTPKSVDRNRSSSGTPKSVGRNRPSSGSPRSVGQDKSTSRTSRTVDRDSSTSVLGCTGSSRSRSRSRSVGRDSSSSCSSRSVSRDSSSSREYCQLHLASLIECQISMKNTIVTGLTNVGGLGLSGVPRSQAVESRSMDGLSHARSISNRDVPTTFPLSEAKFQKIVLTKLVTLTDEVRKMQRSVPQSGIEIKKMDTLEEFQREEASLLEPHKFETLVCQLARVGGRDVKDCTHKVMDRLFTNQLMTKFNMKGKGKKGKLRFEDKTVFSAIKAAVMKWDAAATEAQIKSSAADHLKHAPGRLGGGGY